MGGTRLSQCLVAHCCHHAAPTAWFWPWLWVDAQSASHLQALSSSWPQEGQRWAHSIPPFSEGTHPSPGKGVSSHLFKRPAVICSHSELLHLWMLSLLQVKPLYPMSVSTASRGNAITSTFFWLKPISSFSGATRQSQCPILFRTRPSAWPWKCWCHHTWNTTTSHLSHDRAESFKRLIKIITTLF